MNNLKTIIILINNTIYTYRLIPEHNQIQIENYKNLVKFD